MSSMDHLILLPTVLLENHTPENLIFKSSRLFKVSKHSSQLSGLQFTNNGTFFVSHIRNEARARAYY
ncbi:unnamed protein product [Allacma fusca]|uniref:Uncharacterized protein n=1 Tax=Allacma fusca TaxID=39272 RepID=A0A8J2JRD3_9HEXA|nr:unnamed protein product [Allacma fusca]